MKIGKLESKAHTQAVKALQHAHVPYSKFKVGAAVVSGRKIYSGCNIENASFGATVCAERVAILKAVSEGVTEFTDIFVVTPQKYPVPPCALCLQVMREFCSPETRIWLGSTRGIFEVASFKEFYPKSFGIEDIKRFSK